MPQHTQKLQIDIKIPDYSIIYISPLWTQGILKLIETIELNLFTQVKGLIMLFL